MNIIITGDFCPRFRTSFLIEAGKFEKILGEARPIIESADYSLVNVECPVVENPQAKPITKYGPNLSCTSKALDAIKYAGFKGITLANNHVLDYGPEGIQNTIFACKQAGLDIVGIGENKEEAGKILYKKIEDKLVAFINCCEHEFAVATETKPGANPLSPVLQFYSIQESRKRADYVLIIVHGGHEHFQLPSPRMKELYRYFVDCGADAVVNHHQHCYSGYEVHNGKPIFYGIGNFCFDNNILQSENWTEGYMVKLNLKGDITFDLIPYTQCAEKPCVELMQGKKKKQFDEKIRSLNAIVADDKKLAKQHKEWMDATSDMYEIAASPYSNKYLQAAAYRGLIPMFVNKKRVLCLINYIECEAHRDRMLNMLYSKIK